MQMPAMQQPQPQKESLAMSLPPELRHLADQDEEKVSFLELLKGIAARINVSIRVAADRLKQIFPDYAY